MKKKFLAIVLTVALAVLGTVSMLAVDEPVVTNDAVVYVSYNSGNNDYSGKSADEAKKQLLTLDDNAACSILRSRRMTEQPIIKMRFRLKIRRPA